MTRHLELDIQLLDDVVFSLRPSTQGEHQALDRIPGTALSGWAATWLHRYCPQQAQALAHEGGLRFGDARPVSASGARTHPMPFSLMYDKGRGTGVEQAGCLQADQLINRSHPEADKALATFAQAKGARGGHISLRGEVVRTQSQYRLRTAVQADTGSARKSHLFGYESLAAGQRFKAVLQVADGVDPDTLQRLLQALTGTIRLGRSRASEYGRAKVTITESHGPTQPQPQGDCLTLWLQSDTQLRDEHGRPTLAPDGDAMGVPGARLVPGRSAVRHRSYSAWNAHRNAHTAERQVLVAGSVLVLQRPGVPFTPDELAALSRGVGCETEQGLGEVWVNSPLLASLRPVFGTGEGTSAETGHSSTNLQAPPAAPDTPLLRFLQRATGSSGATLDPQAWALAHAWKQQVGLLLQAARRYRGVGKTASCGPAASQWGGLATALQTCSSPADLQPLVIQKVLGLAVADAGLSQGKAGVHRNVKRGQGWETAAEGATLAQLLEQLLLAQLGSEDPLPASWKTRLRHAAHACHEIRRAELHTLAGILKAVGPETAEQPA